ncbi:hypothetical protein J6590_029642 [Homalodisca vitripennis]|nr:hypothetical protein J6590_029642 [Homalodisca vitripennis]
MAGIYKQNLQLNNSRTESYTSYNKFRRHLESLEQCVIAEFTFQVAGLFCDMSASADNLHAPGRANAGVGDFYNLTCDTAATNGLAPRDENSRNRLEPWVINKYGKGPLSREWGGKNRLGRTGTLRIRPAVAEILIGITGGPEKTWDQSCINPDTLGAIRSPHLIQRGIMWDRDKTDREILEFVTFTW